MSVAEIKKLLETLPVKKSLKINFEGKKIKVVRKNETAFEIYNDGHFITTDETWEKAFELAQVLLQHK
jgi:hypothetical protein